MEGMNSWHNAGLLKQIVSDLLAEHVEGVPFFDALDATWRSPRGTGVVGEFVAYAAHRWEYAQFVASGRFGMFLHNRWESYFRRPLLLVTGGLRTDALMDDLWYWHGRQEFIFLDDSFYSGKTRDAIRGALQRRQCDIFHTFVIYDGCRERHADVASMFRYWDHYNPESCHEPQRSPGVQGEPGGPVSDLSTLSGGQVPNCS